MRLNHAQEWLRYAVCYIIVVIRITVCIYSTFSEIGILNRSSELVYNHTPTQEKTKTYATIALEPALIRYR